MLKLFDDIENPYSPSGDRSGSISMHSTGMGQRILSDNKGHDWEELLLMVSNDKDRVAFRQLFNHFAPRIKSFLMKAGADPTMAEECSQEAMATVWNKAHPLELKQQSEILADAIQNLPEKQRQLVEKAFFKELSHSEIALETGLPLGTIKSRIRLALERLRHAMG